MTSERIQEQLKKHGYVPGDALTIGPAYYATQRLWLGIAAIAVACVGAWLDSRDMLVGGLISTGALVLAHDQRFALNERGFGWGSRSSHGVMCGAAIA